MYKVCGSTNYECNCEEEQIFGTNLNLDDAMKLFVSLANNQNSLDFTEFDKTIDEWAKEFNWDEEDYYSGIYGGCIVLLLSKWS